MDPIKSFAEVLEGDTLRVVTEALEGDGIVDLDLSEFQAEDSDKDEFEDYIKDVAELIVGPDPFSDESTTAFRDKSVLQALFKGLPVFRNLSLTAFPSRALNMTTLRSGANPSIMALAKLLAIETGVSESMDMHTFATVYLAIASDVGAYKAMTTNGIKVKIDVQTATLIKGKPTIWNESMSEVAVVPEPTYQHIAEDLAKRMSKGMDKVLLKNLASATSAGSGAGSRASSRSRDETVPMAQRMGSLESRGVDQPAVPTMATNMLADFLEAMGESRDPPKSSSWGEIQLKDTELEPFSFVAMNVDPNLPLSEFLARLEQAMGVSQNLLAYPALDGIRCRQLKSLVMAMPRYSVLITFGDGSMPRDNDMDDALVVDINRALFSAGVGFSSMDHLSLDWFVAPVHTWEESTARGVSTDGYLTRLKEKALPAYWILAMNAYETEWAWTRIVSTNTPVNLGAATGLIQTSATDSQITILAWNRTVGEYGRSMDEAYDLTNAQNMGLPVLLMASGGDSNTHKATGGQATYYDANVVLVGAQTAVVKFLCFTLAWSKAGGDGANSTGGETLALCIPMATYMGQIMSKLTAKGVRTSGAGFETKGKYVIGNASCGAKGPYAFTGYDLNGSAVTAAQLRAFFKTCAATAYLVEVEGVINPQYVHTSAGAVVDRDFSVDKCTYRFKCRSMSVIMPVGTHQELGTPGTQTSTPGKSSFKNQGGTMVAGPIMGPFRGRR